MNPLDDEQTHALALLVHRLRPRWDIPGIQAAIRKAGAMTSSPWVLVTATLKAAEDEKNHTPAVIAMSGTHWHGRALATPTPPRHIPCDEPGHTGDIAHCPECIANTATPETIARIRAEARTR